ncbi:hypothetical protein ACK30V_05720 [Aeromonas caviae]
MLDPQTLPTALLAAVSDDGSSIGNQFLLEVFKGQERGSSVLRIDGLAPAPKLAAKSRAAKQDKDAVPAETTIDSIKCSLWASAEKLRANMNSAENKHFVLGSSLSSTSPTPSWRAVKSLSAASPTRVTATICTTSMTSPRSRRWEVLWANTKQADIGKRFDDALVLIEQENPCLKGILDKRYACTQFPDGKLGELVERVSTIGFGNEPEAA